MTKFLIAGFGSIGRRHFRNLLAIGQKDILLYRTGKSTLEDDEIKDFPVETDLHKALACKPDAVIVANPTAYHLDVAIPAAEAGCHLLLEKPVSHNLEGIDRLEKALQRGGGKALVGYQFRFHPVLQQVKQLLDQQAVGAPISGRFHWGEYLPGWHPWEDYRNSYSAREDLGGGVVLTLSHPLDYLRWFFGDVKSVMASVGHLSPLELAVEDHAEMLVNFRKPFQASLHLNYYQQPPKHQFEIICSEGTITWDNSDATAHVYSAQTKQWQTIAPPQDFERNDLFLAETRHFCQVIEAKMEPLCTLEDGKAAIELSMAVFRSSETQEVQPLS